MENEINSRIKMLIEHEGMSVNAFSKRIGFNQSNLSKVIRDERDAPLSLVEAVAKNTNVSAEWLLTGDGDMFSSDDAKNKNKNTVITRPRLPVTVAAGMLSEYIGGIMAHQCEQMPVINNFPSYDFTMFVKGDSMEPKYEGGDEIACRKVEKVIEWGKAYVVDTNDGAFLKRIYDNGDSIKCVSYNSEYPDFNVEKTDIHGIYRVVGLLRL